MKIFLNGSRYIHSYVEKNELPESIKAKIDEFIENGVDFIVGDEIGSDAIFQKYLVEKQYFHVTVFYSGTRKSNNHINLGGWLEKSINGQGETRMAHRLEKNLSMVQEADEGVFLWDGSSNDCFVNMTCLAIQSKKSLLYLANKKKSFQIESLDDLKGYYGSPSELQDDLIDSILRKCGMSLEMSEYLVNEKLLNEFDLIDIISQAPISIEKKRNLLRSLPSADPDYRYDVYRAACKNLNRGMGWKYFKNLMRSMADWREEGTLRTSVGDEIRCISTALEYCNDIQNSFNCDEMLYLFSEWYDTEVFLEKSSGIGAFDSLSQILKYINNEQEEGEELDEYYRIETCYLSDPNHINPMYEYYIFNNDICWFNKLVPNQQDNGNVYFLPESRRFSSGILDLDIPVPYKTGDIVQIDCRPFGPPFHAMILEEDKNDCCFPTMVFNVPYTDKWRLTSLKHKRFYKDVEGGSYCPILSPLYRLRSINEDELLMNDECLVRLSKMIKNNEILAEKIWSYWNAQYDNDITFEEVKTLFSNALRG